MARAAAEGWVMGGWSRARPHFRLLTEIRLPRALFALQENNGFAGQRQTIPPRQPTRGECHARLPPVTDSADSLNPVSGPVFGTHRNPRSGVVTKA